MAVGVCLPFRLTGPGPMERRSPAHPAPGNYTIHGANVTMEWDNPSIGRAVHAVLDYFGFSCRDESPSAPHVRMRLLDRGRSPGIPKSVVLIALYNGVEIWKSADHFYLRDGDSIVEVHPASGTARGVLRTSPWLRPNIIRMESITLIIHGVLLLLRRRAFYPLHAAAVTNGDYGVLFVAESDGGKSTLALSLVMQGWKYLSDDSILLRPNVSYVEALPLRRDFGLDEEAVRYVPAMARHWRPFFTDERKRRVDMASLFPGQAANSSTPRLLVFPRIVNEGESRLTPIGRMDALSLLMQQSSLLALEPGVTTAHLDVLGRLVRQAISYQLTAGRDLRDDPALLPHLLARIIPAVTTPTVTVTPASA